MSVFVLPLEIKCFPDLRKRIETFVSKRRFENYANEVFFQAMDFGLHWDSRVVMLTEKKGEELLKGNEPFLKKNSENYSFFLAFMGRPLGSVS